MEPNRIRHALLPCVAICLAWLFIPAGHAENDRPAHAGYEGATSGLPEELRRLLLAEMRAVQDGMIALVPAIAAGNWAQIAEIGHAIHDSYLLKQSLSAEELERLHLDLPTEFRNMDEQFHRSASRMARAARAKDPELVLFYFNNLTEGCVACHSRYAGERFPALGASQQLGKHRH